MPLNIDIQQILLHLLNFAILAFGLYMLLYKPIRKFMEERTEHYEKMDREANEKLKNATSMEETYKAQLLKIDSEIRRQKSEATRELDAINESKLQNAKEQAEKILSDAKKEAKLEHDRIVEAARTDIAELASAAAEKIVNVSLEDAYDDFLNEVSKEESATKEEKDDNHQQKK